MRLSATLTWTSSPAAAAQFTCPLGLPYCPLSLSMNIFRKGVELFFVAAASVVFALAGFLLVSGVSGCGVLRVLTRVVLRAFWRT